MKSNDKSAVSQNEFRSFTASNKTPTHERYGFRDDDDNDEEEVEFNQIISRKTKTQLYSPKSYIPDDSDFCNEDFF